MPAPLAAAAPAIASGVISLVGGLTGNSAAKKARKAANAIERQRLGLATQLQRRYFEDFVPLQDRAIALASRRIDPAVEAAAAGADVERQAGIQRQIMLRDFGRRGIDPASGAAVDAQLRLGLGAGLGRAAAETVARRSAGDRELNNLLAVSDMGAPLLGQASAGLADIGRARAARADLAGQTAGKAWGQVGESVADLIDYFANRS